MVPARVGGKSLLVPAAAASTREAFAAPPSLISREAREDQRGRASSVRRSGEDHLNPEAESSEGLAVVPLAGGVQSFGPLPIGAIKSSGFGFLPCFTACR